MPFLSNTGPRTSLVNMQINIKLGSNSSHTFHVAAPPPPPFLPQGFLFHCRYDFCVYVHVEIKLEAEALLAGVLQGEQTHCKFTQVGLQLVLYASSRQIHRGAPSHCTGRLRQKNKPGRYHYVISSLQRIIVAVFLLHNSLLTTSLVDLSLPSEEDRNEAAVS